MSVKVGDKYIIEIGEVYETTAELVSEVGEKTCETPDNLYRIKGFNSLVFDEYGLDKLQQLNLETVQELAYQRGLNDAWEAARKLRITKENYPDMVELRELFHIAPPKNDVDILKDFSASEVISKIKAWEQKKAKQEDFKVGDELVDVDSKEKCVIIGLRQEVIRIVWSDGSVGLMDKKDFRKTGRSFPQIAEVLKQLQEDKE
ncbi:MAG: hypothetical protein J6T10_22870 [Methanobrevibacter sp.]|nr:hypothetical protein [Methanobrevibacter sp.]